MQSLGTFISDNKGATIVVALLAAILAAAVLIFLYRLAFGRRLHMTGGRSRQPRLGVVDAFDLDRQRQLVLVRRDNVEHLLMIGGPNDLVIESAFVRVQSSIAVPGGRDKEGPVATPPVVPMPLTPSAPESGVAPVDARPFSASTGAGAQVPEPGRAAPLPLDLFDPAPRKDLGPLADIPAPGPVAAAPPHAPTSDQNEPAEPAPSTVSAEPDSPQPPSPTALPSGRPFPSRLGQVSARPAGGAPPPRPTFGSLRSGPTSDSTTPPAPRPPSLLPNRPMPLTPLQRGTSAASLRRDPPPPQPPAEPPPAKARDEAPPPAPENEQPAASETPPSAPPSPVPAANADRPEPKLPSSLTLDTLESLEEEMAKLLGRAGSGDKG